MKLFFKRQDDADEESADETPETLPEQVEEITEKTSEVELPETFKNTLPEAQQLCKGRIVFNDLERSDWAYLLFNILARPVFHNSYIVEDGLASLKRSYTFKEL